MKKWFIKSDNGLTKENFKNNSEFSYITCQLLANRKIDLQTSAKSLTLFKSLFAILGVPLERLAISRAPSGSISITFSSVSLKAIAASVNFLPLKYSESVVSVRIENNRLNIA